MTSRFGRRPYASSICVLAGFSTPVVVIGTKAYVGGKSLEGSGGKEPDFLLKNEITTHVLIVEIKTPVTELLGKSPYRPPDVYAVSRDVAGAVVQIGRYKDEFLANYGNLKLKAEEPFLLADPRCLVVIGCTDQLDNRPKRDSFEQFRRGLRSTELITFDELFGKSRCYFGCLKAGSKDATVLHRKSIDSPQDGGGKLSSPNRSPVAPVLVFVRKRGPMVRSSDN